jgi:DNA sulfur modification protein DndD
MQFKSAHITNFKLLEDLEVDFSNDGLRPLTVVRAENASGKTSLLIALQWGLYGDAGLDAKGLPLSPTHWPAGVPCEIRVEISFRHTTYSVVAGQTISNTDPP